MKKAILAASAFMMSATAALAIPGGTGCTNCVTSTSVPEISALEGTAALAAVAAIVLLAWERRRRAA